MNKSQKQKTAQTRQNILESLKDLGDSTAKSIGSDVLKPKDFLNQVLGFTPNEKYSGEISPGEAVEIKDVYSGKREEDIRTRNQISLERKLLEEEKIQVEKKTNELKIQLHALIEEVKQLADNTQELGEEVKIASISAPVEPGVYHVIFFEKLLEFIKSFRKKVEDASNWLHSINKRAQKKNYWSSYKKYGAKFLLSGEHYLTRNAG